MAGSLIGGAQANNQNNRVLAKVDGQSDQQNALIQQLMSGIDRNAYMQQAQGAGDQALGQLSADDASRGLLNSGAHSRVAASTLSDIYQNANAKYQGDRQNAIGMALGARQSLGQAYGQQYNPNPYSGLAPSLSGVGAAGASYLDYLTKNKPPATTG